MDIAQRERRIQTVCLLILSAVAAALALYWLRPVMVPFVLALFVALGLSPLVEYPVRQWNVPRSLAILGTLGLAVVFFGLLGVLVSASVTQLGDNAAAYQERVTVLLQRLTAFFPLERFGIDRGTVSEQLTSIPTSTIGNLLLGTTNAIVGLLSQSLLVGIFVIYLLIGQSGATEGEGAWTDVVTRVQRYLATKLVLSAATGLIVGLTLAILGIDLAMVFGLFAFLLNFIPSVGSLIATLLPLPVVLVSPEVGAPTAILAIAVPGAIQFAIGNVAEPKIMGDALDLHPIAILLGLIFWGMLWGIVGMLLATPITAILKILIAKLEHTAAISELLAGRPSVSEP